ncbi:MAG: 50S ribosomal protein L30 [Alphaproteobacteria bacterium]|nr:50S ribosomal protein L30 [Alphaproteobacteria bacterium]
MVKKEAKASSLIVTQIGSQIGCVKNQRDCLKGLGLGKIGKKATLADDPCVRGMIRKVSHLVKVEVING